MPGILNLGLQMGLGVGVYAGEPSLNNHFFLSFGRGARLAGLWFPDQGSNPGPLQ